MLLSITRLRGHRAKAVPTVLLKPWCLLSVLLLSFAMPSVHAQATQTPEAIEKILRDREAERERINNLPFVEAVYVRLKKNRNLRDEDHTLMSPSTAAELSRFAGAVLKPDRPLGGASERVLLPRKMSPNEVRALCAKLNTHPEVDSCELATPGNIEAQGSPNDPLYPDQWSLRSIAPGSIVAEPAWDISTGVEWHRYCGNRYRSGKVAAAPSLFSCVASLRDPQCWLWSFGSLVAKELFR
jgi:hypothetical protein